MVRRSLAVFAISLLLLSMQRVAAQSPARAPGALPFEPVEELVYEGEFTKLVLRGVKIAELRFTAGRARAPVPGTPAPQIASTQAVAGATPALPFLFTGEVNSEGFFSRLFGIHFNFRIASTVEPNSFVVLRTDRHDQQGNRLRVSEAIFDRTANNIIWTERDPNAASPQPTQTATLPLGDTSHDILSALYFLRTQELTPGRSFELVVSDSGRIYRVPVRVAERSRMRTALGQMPVVRLEMDIFGEGRIVAGEGQMALWITDDARRIPVLARLDHSMGTLEITLKQVSRGAGASAAPPPAPTRTRRR